MINLSEIQVKKFVVLIQESRESVPGNQKDSFGTLF